MTGLKIALPNYLRMARQVMLCRSQHVHLDPDAPAQEKDAGLKWVHEEVERVKGLFQGKEQRLAARAADAEAAAADASAAASSAEQRCEELEGRLATVSAACEVRPAASSARDPCGCWAQNACLVSDVFLICAQLSFCAL